MKWNAIIIETKRVRHKVTFSHDFSALILPRKRLFVQCTLRTSFITQNLLSFELFWVTPVVQVIPHLTGSRSRSRRSLSSWRHHTLGSGKLRKTGLNQCLDTFNYNLCVAVTNTHTHTRTYESIVHFNCPCIIHVLVLNPNAARHLCGLLAFCEKPVNISADNNSSVPETDRQTDVNC